MAHAQGLARADVRRHRPRRQSDARPGRACQALEDRRHEGEQPELADGTPAHSFSTLLAVLATIVRNVCRTPQAKPDAPTFEILTTPTATQQRALALIQQITL